MTMSAIVTDHVEELLALVLRFTRARRRVLIDNLRYMDREGFVPQDLAVQEFSEQLHTAITEHRTHHRLVLRDNPHLRFGEHGRVDPVSEADPRAKALLDSDLGAYLQYQMQRLLENALNEKVACRMLRGYTGGVLRRATHGMTPARPCWPPERAGLNDDMDP